MGCEFVQRMPTTFKAAKQLLDAHLSQKRLCLTNYRYRQYSVECTCDSYIISDVGKGADANDTASFTVTIGYKAFAVTEDKLQQADKSMVLNILSTAGDYAWGYNNIQRIWRGDYPSAAAVEDSSGEIYFLYLRSWGTELCYFATLTAEQLGALSTLHLESPYALRLSPPAMFGYIEGDIGLLALREAVEIELNTTMPIIVGLSQYDRNVVNKPSYGAVK